MSDIQTTIDSYLEYPRKKESKRILVEQRFGLYIKEFNDFHFSLSLFAAKIPFCYFSYERVEVLYNVLKYDVNHLFDALVECKKKVSHAVRSMFVETRSWGNEESFRLKEAGDFTGLDSFMHHEYVRYYESVFDKLIRPIIYFLDKTVYNRRYNYNADADVCVSILNSNNLSKLTAGFNSFIRNAIDHGSITYGIDEIKYVSKRRSLKLQPVQFGELFDDLVESCNSIIIAFLLVLANCSGMTEKRLKKLPWGLVKLFLEGNIGDEDLQISALIESHCAHSKPQLNMHMKTTYISPVEHYFAALSIGFSLLKLNIFNPDFFNIFIDSGSENSSVISLETGPLKEIMGKDVPLSTLDTLTGGSFVIDDEFKKTRAWYIKRKERNTLWSRISQRLKGLFNKSVLPSGQYFIKNINNHSTVNSCRLFCNLILGDPFHPPGKTEDYVRLLEEFIALMKTRSFKKQDKRGLPTTREYPPDHIGGTLYTCNRRMRNIEKEDNRILGFEWVSQPGNREPLFLTGDEPAGVYNGIRIAFNPAVFNGKNVSFVVK